MTPPIRAGLALGSNLGDRLDHLLAAIHALRALAVPNEAVLVAPIYQTPPWQCPPGSPDFLNTVMEIPFAGLPLDLLAATRAVENHWGRTRHAGHNSPRTLDIDLLYFGQEQWQNAELQLPHPRLAERRFVLQPLADIRPDLLLPGFSQSIADLLAALPPSDPQIVQIATVDKNLS